jgi:hypothetical protein
MLTVVGRGTRWVKTKKELELLEARLSYLWEYKRKREKFPKRKGEGGKKRNFLRFISTVILPMIKNTENQQKNTLHIAFHLHNILDSKNQELCRFISIMSLQKHFTGVRRVSAVFPFTFL